MRMKSINQLKKEWETCEKCKRPKKVGKICVCEKERSLQGEEE